MTASAVPSSPMPRRPGRAEPLRRRQLPSAPPAPWRRRALNCLLLFVIVVLAADGLIGQNGLLQQLRARETFEGERQKLEALREENQALRADIRRLREDPGAVEALARKELGLIRPGEILFIVTDTTPASR